ncbi:MAG: response regulator [Myxococcota bacterium]
MRRILLVDDEPFVRPVLVEMLECLGYDVLEAVDGVHALEMLEAHAVDLVLSDIRMPRLDGVALARQIGARWPGLLVLLMTGHGPGVDTGAWPVLPKPFLLEDLEAFLARAAP